MLKLEEKDPEFFKFLKENDEELLEFDESDDEDDDDEHNDDVLVTDDETGTDESKKVRIFIFIAGFIQSGKVRGKGSFLLWSGKVREACSGQGQNSIFILQVREIFHFSPSKKYVQHFNNQVRTCDNKL